jgi:hypothetical protein
MHVVGIACALVTEGIAHDQLQLPEMQVSSGKP